MSQSLVLTNCCTENACIVLCCVVLRCVFFVPRSRSVKELKESISGAQLDAGDLEQQAQHLKRQLATLADRIKRLESQVGVLLLCTDGVRGRVYCTALTVWNTQR